MLHRYKLFIFSTVLTSSLLIGCGSSTEEEPTINVDTTPASIPADAIVITQDNAIDVIGEANLSSSAAQAYKTGTDSSQPASVSKILSSATNRLKTVMETGTVTGKTDNVNCALGGSYTAVYTQTTTSASGKVRFNNCNDDGYTINGAVGIASTLDTTLNAYSFQTYGALDISGPGESFRIYGIDITETGDNDSPYPYTLDISFAVTGLDVLGGGLMFETTTPISGVVTAPCAYTGTILISGANGTRLRVTLNINQVSVELDDGNNTNGTDFVALQGSPFDPASTTDVCF